MSVKEIQLKLIKGKIFKVFSLTRFIYYSQQFTGTKPNFLRRLKWEMFNLFTIRNTLVTPRTIFQGYHPGYFVAKAMQNPVRLSILGSVLKPEAI